MNPIFYTFSSILDLFRRTDNSDATFNVTELGSYTANFKEIPSPIPKEYLVGLFGIVATTIVGWSIPSIISGIKSRREIRKLNYYHKIINTVYDDGKLDEKDIESLDKLKVNISDAYAKGKLNNEHYSNLKDEISILYQEIFKKRIESINNIINKKDKEKQIEKITDKIEDAYSKAKISNLHYNLLNKKISEFENKNNMNGKNILK